MTTFSKMMATVVVAASTLTAGFAQLSLGDDCGCPALAERDSVNMATLTDGDGNLSGNTTLSCDAVYYLTQKVYVPENVELTIAAGTVIKGTSVDDPNDATALIVSRGGKLWANGTDCCPIIFTSAADNLDGAYGVGNKGDWGGVIMLGRATNNLLAGTSGAPAEGLGIIEGIELTTEARNQYGADINGGESFDDDDCSGSLSYVSIRHAGAEIQPDNEINGLTLGSVGRGTRINHIEVIANDDDGIECFGGTVNMDHITVMYCADDYLDVDQGYTGTVQFFFGVQGPAAQFNNDAGNNGMELDGDDGNDEKEPLSAPQIYNATIIGNGLVDDADDNNAMNCREGLRGTIQNCIFANFDRGIELGEEAGRTINASTNFTPGDTLFIASNCFVGVSTNITVNQAAPSDPNVSLTFGLLENQSVPSIPGFDFTFNIDPVTNAVSDAYNPVPNAGEALASTSPADFRTPGSAVLVPANYKGAFKPGAAPWTEGWTLGALIGTDNSLIPCPTDIDGDRDTDVDDFLELLGQFGQSCDQ